jgi:hypothetical protein
VLTQETAPLAERGSATASNLFSRNLGSTLGATVLGAVVNFRLSGDTGNASVNADQLRRLIEAPEQVAGATAQLQTTLDSAMHLMFQCVWLMTIVIVIAAVLVPDLGIDRAKKGVGQLPSRGDRSYFLSVASSTRTLNA